MNNLGNKEIMAKNIQRLLNLKDKTRNEICSDLNFKYTTFADWINGNKYPRIDKIEMMANYFGVSKSELVDTPSPSNHIKGVRIPLLGRVVAGVPLEAIENIEGYEEITPTLAAKGSYFALRVMGKSMEPFFLENDIVIVRKTKSIESGAIAIVLVNGNEATVKKVKIQDNGVTLIGFNTSVYEPHFYNSEEVKALPLEIIGQVVESKRILVNV